MVEYDAAGVRHEGAVAELAIDLSGAREIRDDDDDGVPEVTFRRGDANDSGTLDVSDAIFSLFFLFLRTRPPPCEAAADINGDNVLDVSDVVYLLGFLFLGGSTPAVPFPDCGVVSMPPLGCRQSIACR